MKKIFLVATSILVCLSLSAQKNEKRNFSFYVFKPKAVKTNILSACVAAYEADSLHQIKSCNGVRIELLGLGLFSGLAGRSPIAENDSEFVLIKNDYRGAVINGINISGTGSVINAKINGISVGFVGEVLQKVNGLSVVGMFNFVQEHNGIMAAAHFNQAYKLNGVQVGFTGNYAYYGKGVQLGVRLNYSENFKGLQVSLHNVAKNLKGIQIGLWNVNQKRKLPIFNWNFS